MTAHEDNPFSKAIRDVLAETDTPLELCWETLRKSARANHAHLTEKELFFAGAGALFDAIVHSLTAGDEPSESDLVLLTKIHTELTAFHEHFNRKIK